ncbi:MAG: outer rane efflux protein [Rhizobacter sp.]|nr:outer rane efflux protein [Rhizobacter sp.]
MHKFSSKFSLRSRPSGSSRSVRSSGSTSAASARAWPVVGVVMAAVLSGCTLMPAYQRPTEPVVAQLYPNQPAAGATATPAATIEWRTFFSDSRLQRLIEIALANNRDLRVALLNIEAARAQFQITRSAEFPTIGVTAAGTRQPLGAGGSLTTYQVGFALSSYEVDLFGRIRSLSAQALATYLATEEARRTTQISLVSSVAIGYLNLLSDDELIRLTRDTIKTREDSLRLTQLRFDAGVVSELDLRQAQSLVEGGRATLAQQQRQRGIDLDALTLLLGQPIPDELPGGLPLASQAIAELPPGLPSDLLANRPDIRAAEQQLIAANANIGAARAAFFPSITLTAGAGTVSSELSGLFKGGSFGWAFAPQITLPIFTGGRNQANLELSFVNRDIAVANYERSIQSAFRDVADALAGRDTLREQTRALQAQSTAEEARFRLSDLRYRNGVASFLDLLDAQRSLFAAQQSAIQSQTQQLENLVTLYRVLGGGWTPADANVVAPMTTVTRR